MLNYIGEYIFYLKYILNYKRFLDNKRKALKLVHIKILFKYIYLY